MWQDRKWLEVLGGNYYCLAKLFPIQLAEKSDSANLDNAIELLLCSGKSLLEVASILVPPAWENNTETLRTDMSKLFKIIDAFLDKCVDIAYFQIHHAGDFISQTEIDNWLSLSKKYKDIHFMAFTKRFEFSYTITDNFKIIYSVWPRRKMPPLNGIPLAFLDIDDFNRYPLNYNFFRCPISQSNTDEDCKRCFNI